MMRRFMDIVRAYPLQTALSLFAAVATLLAGIGLMSSSGYLISRAALRPPILDLMLIIVAVRFFALSRAAARYLERLVSHDLTFKWLMQLRLQTYERLEPLMPGLLLKQRSGDLLSRMANDVDTLQNLYLRVAAPALAAAAVSLLTVAALFFFSPLLAGTTLAFLLLNGVAVPWLITARARGVGMAQIQEQSVCTATVVEQLQGMRDACMLGRDGMALDELEAHNQKLGALQSRQARVTGLQDALSHLCSHLGLWSVLALAIPLVAAGELAGVHLALLTLGVLTSFESVQNLGSAFQFHEQTVAADCRLQDIASEPHAIALPASRSRPDQPHVVQFKAVSFAYADDLVLKDISFEWASGTRVAVVGPSGSGKSTLLHLLLRFRDPDQGVIQWGDQALSAYHPDDLIKQIAVVPQHTHLFNGTIRSNLKLARSDATDDDMWSALDHARLADFVRQLPAHLDTEIGELGAQLSGGERQRLALARAILKEASLWVLDEPTAHLDPHTEREVVDRLLTLTQNRSTLWITHRLTGLEAMNTLIILHDGHIEEIGTHAELVAHNGYYARMLRQQNQMVTASL